MISNLYKIDIENQPKEEIAEAIKKYLTDMVIDKDTIPRCYDEIEELMMKLRDAGKHDIGMDEIFDKYKDFNMDKLLQSKTRTYFISTPSERGMIGIGQGISGVQMSQLYGGYPSPSHARSVRVSIGDTPPQDIQLMNMVEILNNTSAGKDYPILLLDSYLEPEDELLDRFKNVTSMCAGLTYNCPDPHSLATLITSITEEPEGFRNLDCDYDTTKFFNSITGKEQQGNLHGCGKRYIANLEGKYKNVTKRRNARKAIKVSKRRNRNK